MLNRKTAWLESQYLYPHHFQQHERYLEGRIEARASAIRPFVWGISRVEFDSRAMVEGRVALTAVQGVMPDGTPFQLPEDGPLPTPLQVPNGAKDVKAYLALPRYQPGSRHLDTDLEAGGADRVARYRLQMLEVFDYATGNAAPESIETAVLNFSLLLDTDDLGGYATVPLLRVRELTQEGAVVTEQRYIPPRLDVGGCDVLRGYLSDIIGMLQQRGEALAVRFNQPGKSGGSSAITDFLLLQLMNRFEPRLRHMAGLPILHPEQMFAEFIALAGELSTFTTAEKRPGSLPTYRHDDLYGCFRPLMDVLEREFSAVLEQTAIPIPIEERQFGIRVARLPDRSLLNQGRFVLAAKADMPTEALREQFPDMLKVGAVETIRDLVNNQLPGVPVKALPVAPREIAYHAGNVYFELEQNDEAWKQLRNAGGFAFHVGGDLPDLKLEFWAIRD